MAEPHEAQARVEQLERIEKCLTDRIATRDREVDELGSEVDALKQERDSLQIAYEDAVTEAAMQESYRKDIQKEAETLRTALRKYADGNNWVCPRCGKRGIKGHRDRRLEEWAQSRHYRVNPMWFWFQCSQCGARFKERHVGDGSLLPVDEGEWPE